MYSTEKKIIQYEPTGKDVHIDEMIDYSKYNKLTKHIFDYYNEGKINKEVCDFLVACATRHLKLNFSKIAEFYCNQDKYVQELMEEQALVIIDYKDALELGYVELSKELRECYNEK